SHPGARLFAGGTDLMVVLEAGQLPPGRYVDLQHCPELLGIEHDSAGVAIRALTTHTQVRHPHGPAGRHPLLPLPAAATRGAGAETGGVATQNRGTIGGNIANASPAADTPPALLVYDAELELMSARATRRVRYETFHLGYKKMDLQPGELIARVHLPPRPAVRQKADAESWRDYYRKVGPRRAQAISKVCLAASIQLEQGTVKDVRIALGSVAPTVIRAFCTEDALRGRPLDGPTIAAAEQMLASEIAPIDDVRSTARYRTRVAVNLLREFLGVG